MKVYETRSIRLQNYLAENGIYPVNEQGKTAYYNITKEFYLLLDRYNIIQEVFKGRY